MTTPISHTAHDDAPLSRAKTRQTHVQKYMPQLLQMIIDGNLDTTFLTSHRMSLEEAPAGYKMFKERQNEVTKVGLKPQGVTRH